MTDDQRVTTYCNVCNAVTVTPTCALCANCLHYLSKGIERTDPGLLEALHYDPQGLFKRTSKDAPVHERLQSVLDRLIGDDLRAAVHVARRVDEVEKTPTKKAQWTTVKWTKPKPLCDN